jgi:hypothetical protein
VNWPTFKAYINLIFIVVVKPPKSLRKPMVSGVFLTQKVCTTTNILPFELVVIKTFLNTKLIVGRER